MENKKAIVRVLANKERPISEGEVHYDCDYSLINPIIEQINEMGAPITLYDLMELVEGKLSGKIVSGTQDKHLVYTLIVSDKTFKS